MVKSANINGHSLKSWGYKEELKQAAQIGKRDQWQRKSTFKGCSSEWMVFWKALICINF
jgi:hypothetical protein